MRFGRKTLVLALFGLLMAACVPAPAQDDPSLIAQAAQARAQAEAAQATASSAEYVARANEMALTATAEAPSVQMTATMAALEVYSTRQALDATATAQSWTPTPSQTPTPDLTATVAVMEIRAQQTVSAKQSSDYIVTSELELRRKVSINNFYAALPGLVFVLIAGSFVILLFGQVRANRYKAAPINAEGQVLDIQSGTITVAGRNPNYRSLTVEDLWQEWLRRRMALPEPLPEITAERQDATTARAQTVELARATSQARQLPASNFPMLASPAAMSGERFEVVDGANALGDLGPEIMEILDAQWRDV